MYLPLGLEHGVTKGRRDHLSHLLVALPVRHSAGGHQAPPGGLPQSKARLTKQRFGLLLVLADFSASLSLKLFMYKTGTRGLLTIVMIISKII